MQLLARVLLLILCLALLAGFYVGEVQSSQADPREVVLSLRHEGSDLWLQATLTSSARKVDRITCETRDGIAVVTVYAGLHIFSTPKNPEIRIQSTFGNIQSIQVTGRGATVSQAVPQP